MIINVVGRERFRINEITWYLPYQEEFVELLEDDVLPGLPLEEMERVRGAVIRQLSLILGTKGGWVREVKIPVDPVALS